MSFDPANEKPLTLEQRQERVFNLNLELKEVKIKKKAVSSAWLGEQKRIEAEIKDLLSEDLYKDVEPLEE